MQTGIGDGRSLRTWRALRAATAATWRGGSSSVGALGALVLAAGCASTGGIAGLPATTDGAPGDARATAVAAPGKPDKLVVDRANEFSSLDLGFALDKPAGEDWAMATDVTSPEGRPIPVVVAHPESGAQIVVQVSKPLGPPQELADVLRGKLKEEKTLSIGDTAKLQNRSGLEAWGFPFAVKGEASGRVAIIQVGDKVVLVVASWPETADKKLVQQVDSVVSSVRAASDTEPTLSRPDKA